MRRPRSRTAWREAINLLRQKGIHAELIRGQVAAKFRDACDAWLGWALLAAAVAWFAVARYVTLPRLFMIPPDWRLSAVADLIQFWTQVTATFVGLVIPFTILLAGWLERQPQLRLAFGPLAWRRPIDLVSYLVAVLITLGVMRAATSLRPGDALVLCDALLLAPLIATSLAVRTALFAVRVLRLLDTDYAARALAERAERTIRVSVLHELTVRAANNILSQECEAAGIACGFGLQSRRSGTVPHLARRGGFVADINLDALRRLGRAVSEASPQHSPNKEKSITFIPRIGMRVEAGKNPVAELPASAPEGTSLASLAEGCLVLSRSFDVPDARPCLEILRQMAFNALRAGDLPSFETAVGTLVGLVERLSALFGRTGLLFGPEHVSEPFSELRYVGLLEIYLRDLGRGVVKSEDSDFIGRFTHDLFRMLDAAATHGDLMTFTRLIGVYPDVYYRGLELDSAIAKHRPPYHVRDLLDYSLFRRIEDCRTLTEDRAPYLKNLTEMIYRAIDILGEMAKLAAEKGHSEELQRLGVHLAEGTHPVSWSPVSSEDAGPLIEIVRELQARLGSLPGLYGLALIGFIVDRLRQGLVTETQAQGLLDAVRNLPSDVRAFVCAFDAAIEEIRLPGPVERMLHDEPGYDTRRVYSVDTTTRPSWGLAAGVMRAMSIQDEQIAQLPPVPSEAVTHHAQGLKSIGEKIAQESGRWEQVIGTLVVQRAAAFSEWLDRSKAAYEEQDAQRRAAATVSEGKVREIELEVKRRATEAGAIRPWLRRFDCVRSSPELDGEHKAKLGLAVIMDKDPFTEEPRALYFNLADNFGRSVADGETKVILESLLAVAQRHASQSLSEAIRTAVQQVRAHTGPDIILAPWNLYHDCLAVPGLVPRWSVRHECSEPNLLGFLDQVPVITLVGLDNEIVVARFGGNCTLHDIRPLTLTVESVVPGYVDDAKRHYPDADETRLRTLVRVVLEEKIRFDPPPPEAVVTVRIERPLSP